MHLRAARRLGVTRDEIGEVLLQTAIYCGLPAANAAFHIAAEVLGKESRRRPKPAAKRRVRARRARR
jgi:alkylhydroperoxidase/carboxymuconolactone decarboxylase family protein YurZ